MDMISQLQEFGIYRFAAIVAVLLIVGNQLRIIIQDPFKKIPGPLLARFSRFWLFNQYIKGNYHNTDIDLHRKHGMAPTADPAACCSSWLLLTTLQHCRSYRSNCTKSVQHRRH
jgi:hypothetical protein